MEDWAEIRRLHRAEGLAIKAIARMVGVSRNTVRAAIAAEVAPKYERRPAGSIVDAVEREIREQLALDARMPAMQIVAVGAGASMGREGAPRQAAAAVAGWIAEHLGVSAAQQRTLVACGAAPDWLRSTKFRSGVRRSLSKCCCVPRWPPVVGVAFTRLMTTARTRAPSGWRAAASIVVAFGALGVAAIRYPQLLGNGKGMTGVALDGTLTLSLAAVLVVLKPLATAACVGAGAIGGLLTPALATGAVLGVFTGRLWSLAWPGADTVEFAMIGAAMLHAVTLKAPVTAVVLTLEFTGTGLPLLAPMVLGVALASIGARVVDRLTRTGSTG